MVGVRLRDPALMLSLLLIVAVASFVLATNPERSRSHPARCPAL
jgi:hypothetical protein